MENPNAENSSSDCVIEKVQLFRCDECGAEYNEEDEAIECCQPTITEGEYWLCPECGEYCKTESEAIGHCSDQSYRTKLESQGQIRLFP
ncbi:hypothetical protein [Acidihalobacter prosperus]|uniref:Uncharacterized protein n=1 Tax=Acidihalobacter prosperus TaxID=160660 RepID=A0A1A6C338_9GAMM|nr:hypothetical protein [Acidihalobacter prosperus]OBS08960.1 hypothetical protein Thpro_022077 [Acidihalobacter prosperus]